MSVLNDMTQGIVGSKAAKAAKLTPVKGETSTTVAEVAATLPNDVGVFMSNEALITHAKELRKFAADAIAIADGLDAMASGPMLPPSAPVEDPKVTAAAAKKAAEQEGDAKFAERYAAQQEAAQAAVFTSLDAGQPDVESVAPASGWVCPQHGDKSLSIIKPRKGSPYGMCGIASCEEYEKRSS